MMAAVATGKTPQQLLANLKRSSLPEPDPTGKPGDMTLLGHETRYAEWFHI